MATRSLPFCVSARLWPAVFSLVLMASGLASEARADITSVSVNPGTLTLPANSALPVRLVWQINRTETNTASPGPFVRQVSSPSALLQIGGTTVAAVGGTLTQSSVLTAGQSASLRFNEVIQLNVGLARRIANSPAGSVTIVREFSDTQTAQRSSVAVYAGNSGADGLTVRRIDLSFESDVRTDVVEQHAPLRAVANVSFQSSGVLRGEWRIIDPTASLGDGSGRVLQVVRQSLISAGEGRIPVVSPLLPTDRQGLYLLAFSVQDTTARIDIPVLRYYVIDNSLAPSVVELQTLTVMQPLQNAVLGAGTRFAWQPLANAHAYQLEVFRRGEQVPLTGKLVPATETALDLSVMSLDRLSPLSTYQWQLRAFDHRGNVIGVSPRQSIQTP